MNMGFKRLKRNIAVLAVFTMVFSLMPTGAFALEASDISNHWAKDKIQSWMDQGLIKGYDNGTFRPDNNITRAEFMSLVNGAFGFSKSAETNYTDVDANAWYSAAVAAAKAAGYISGYPDNSIKPDSPISRAEAASIIMKIGNLSTSSSSAVKFTDESDFGWSKDAVNAVSSANIMNGYPDGSFQPKEFIKRAEAVAALDKALASSKNNLTYDKAGTYGPSEGTTETAGNVTVSVKDIILQNMIIDGNLIIGQNVGDGNVTLKNVTVKGETKIYGGGQNSILVLDSTLGTVTVSKEDGKIRIVVSGNTTVKSIQALSGAKLEEKDLTGSGGGFREIILNASKDDEIILVGAFDKVTVESEGLKIQMPKGTTVDTLILNKKAAITGTGIVNSANINAGGVTFETKPNAMKVAEGIAAPEIIVPSGGGGGGGGGGGSSSGGSQTVALSAVTVSGSTVVGQVLTANPAPANATVTYQWMSSDSAGGTYTNINGATAKTYTLTPADLNRYLEATATGTGNYTGTVTSAAIARVTASEITGYTTLASVNLTVDERLVDLSALISSRKLPTQVTVTDGTATAAAVITNWSGSYNGATLGVYTLTAAWAPPVGYVDMTPTVITITVNVNAPQTASVIFGVPTAEGSYYPAMGYPIAVVNQMMEAMWATGGAVRFDARDTNGNPITGSYIDIRPIFSVNSDGSELTINASNITLGLLDWLEHDLDTAGRVAIGIRVSGGQTVRSISSGTPLIELSDDNDGSWVGQAVRVNLHDLVAGTNDGTIETSAGSSLPFKVIVEGNLTSVNSITVSSSALEITEDDGTLQMVALFDPSNAYDQSVRWSVRNITGVAGISNTGHGTTGRLYAGKDGTVEVYATSADTGIESINRVTIRISGQAGPAAPAGIIATNVSATGVSDGTLTNVNDTMEYQKDGTGPWIKVADGQTTVSGLGVGSYTVRVAETALQPAGTQTDYELIIGIAPQQTLKTLDTPETVETLDTTEKIESLR